MTEDHHSSNVNLIAIAKRAGVSRSTVSRVVNGEAYVSPETRDRVLAVIDELQYTPNAAARMLRTRRTHMIGVVIPDPVQNVFASDNPYYYSTLIQEISAHTQQRDYAMLLWVGNYKEQDERFYNRVLRHSLMDGLLCIATRASETYLVRKLIDSHMPFVLLGRPAAELADQVSFITVDNIGASVEAVEHLLAQGYQRIGHITGNLDDPDGQDRMAGYQQALRDHGMKPKTLLVEGTFSFEAGYKAMQKLLSEHVDAVFCASDMIAFGAMRAIEEAGRSVPGDIALVGFDDVPLASQTRPSLTTVRQPLAQKARQAARMLLDQIEGQTHNSQQVYLSTKLIVRESSG